MTEKKKNCFALLGLSEKCWLLLTIKATWMNVLDGLDVKKATRENFCIKRLALTRRRILYSAVDR